MLRLNGPVITWAEAEKLDQDELAKARDNRNNGLRRGFARHRCKRLPGPLLRVLPLDEDDVAAGGHHPHGVGRKWHS